MKDINTFINESFFDADAILGAAVDQVIDMFPRCKSKKVDDDGDWGKIKCSEVYVVTLKDGNEIHIGTVSKSSKRGVNADEIIVKLCNNGNCQEPAEKSYNMETANMSFEDYIRKYCKPLFIKTLN